MSHSPSDPANNSGGFVGRWSRRKQQQAEAPSGTELPSGDLPPVDDSVQSAPFVPAPLVDAVTDSEPQLDQGDDKPIVLTDDDMPELETLNADSDYSPFFSEGVSKQLRNLALKKLFFSGKFAARDGLDDYDDDFTRFEPLGDTITSDMKFHERRKEKARLAKLKEEEEQRKLAEQQEDTEAEVAETDVADVEAAEGKAEAEGSAEGRDAEEDGEVSDATIAAATDTATDDTNTNPATGNAVSANSSTTGKTTLRHAAGNSDIVEQSTSGDKA